MKKYLIVALFFLTTTVMGQGINSGPGNFSVQVGAGWVHYVNTLKIGTRLAKEDHPAFSFRLMWEPEHRLSLGIESGFYTFYELENGAAAGSTTQGYAALSYIPLLTNIKMQVSPNFFLTAGTGFGLLLSDVRVLGSSSSSSTLSLADFQLSAMYMKPFGDRFRFGVEFKFIDAAKTEDYAYGLQLVGLYRF